MKLFIYEYFASGAVGEGTDLQQAGLEMLTAVLKDFGAVAGLELLTALACSLKEQGLSGFPPGSAAGEQTDRLQVHWGDEGESGVKLFQKVLDSCEGVFIIAPESRGILAGLTAMAESRGKMIWGSSSLALRTTSNKGELLAFLQSRGWPVPRSVLFKKSMGAAYRERIASEFSLPLIVKPVCGAGGEGVRRIESPGRFQEVLETMVQEEEAGVLVQEYIPGQAVSVSLFVLHGRAQVLSLNRQSLSEREELLFQGITIPYHHPREEEITGMAAAACEQLAGLKGFVGVDLVLGPRVPVIIEINARLTSAYVALRETAGRNLAQDMTLLFAQNILPEKPQLQGNYTYAV
ncbi:ATP-grasp domain-containing protein [Desulfosporosinus lacus]|uniref:ATP-grasp domain-containing protein n=1 Tax=Desulfosporosinus lacus DSM 15449 TaxID=1121420 RepID=A0A1M5V3X9_9FIRM|nr:ATP-grasp domain-containing protein [Desulfosporosinus lacus]SHH69977.1 ATP-grasp domain-containing protein [Desulfosporosinus lacus DSM 15449]